MLSNTKPVIKAKVSSHNHLHFIFDLESEKAEGSNYTLLEYTYFNRIKHRKKNFFLFIRTSSDIVFPLIVSVHYHLQVEANPKKIAQKKRCYF